MKMEEDTDFDNESGSDIEDTQYSDKTSENEEGFSKSLEANGFKNFTKKRHFEEVDSEDVSKTTKKLKKEKISKPGKLPTAEEMIQLQETQILFQSNLFRLQIQEVINEIKPKKYTKNAVKYWLESFKKHLLSVDDILDLPMDRLKWLKKLGISLPLPKANTEFKGFFRFFKPLDVFPIGSLSSGCLCGPKPVIDLAVIMPKKSFYSGDRINQKYHFKRALYLALIASHIKKGNFIEPGSNLQFWTCGDPLKPLLVFQPRGKISYLEIIVHVIPEQGTFQHFKLLPKKSNMRPTCFGFDSSMETFPPTPVYNASIIEDLVVLENEKMRDDVIGNHANIKEAVMLLRVWLKQRGLNKGYGAFSAFIMSMYVVYLMKSQKLSIYMTSYQIIRNVWLSLSKSDWTVAGPSLASTVGSNNLDSFYTNFSVVFIDVTGYCNFASRMNKLTFLKVKHEAELAIKFLDSHDINSFQSLFIIKMPFLRQFDHIICITEPQVLKEAVYFKSDPFSLMDNNNYVIPLFEKELGKLLEEGLNKRALEIWFKLTELPRWNLEEVCRSHLIQEIFMLGIKINPEFAFGLVDKGPEANMPETSEFCSFWSNKTELRRFRDGNVCEAMVWGKEGASLRERRLIVSRIVEFLLENKMNIKRDQFNYVADQLTPLLRNKLVPTAENEETCQNLHNILGELTAIFRDMSALPLSITGVHCISPVYRYTEVFPPVPFHDGRLKYLSKKTELGHIFSLKSDYETVPLYVQPIDLVLQMSLSKKWPDDVAAGKRLLTAFYIAIAANLKKNNEISSQVSVDNIIIQKGGYIFRITMAYGKEISLMKQKLTAEGVKVYRSTPESIELEKKCINLPKITGALYGLNHNHTAFGLASCLAKRWMSAHLLDDFHFPSVLVELLMAHIFLLPHPYTVPQQPLTGFLRFLSLLASTNWQIEHIIVNFNNILSKEDMTEMENHFTSERSSLPPMIVATPYDKTGCLWTKPSPTLPILVRLAKLADTCLRILEIQLATSPATKFLLRAFYPPMSVYDVIIKLKSSMAARRWQSLDWKPMGTPKSSKITELPIVDFDPVKLYVQELRDNYGQYALFFYDIYGGVEVGVLFNRTEIEPKEFKVYNVNGRKPDPTNKKFPLKLDVKALLDDFVITGEGIVETITIINDKYKE